MVISKPGYITPNKKFIAQIYILNKEEGGRHTPFHNKYKPQFYLRTTDVTGTIYLLNNLEMIMPGNNISVDVELLQPLAISEGLRFAIREGGRTVSAGQVIKIIE